MDILLDIAEHNGWKRGTVIRWKTKFGEEVTIRDNNFTIRRLVTYNYVCSKSDGDITEAERRYLQKYRDFSGASDFVIAITYNSAYSDELFCFPIGECEIIKKPLTAIEIKDINTLLEKL